MQTTKISITFFDLSKELRQTAFQSLEQGRPDIYLAACANGERLILVFEVSRQKLCRI